MQVQDRDTFFLVEAEGEIRIDVRDIAERLGRPLPMWAFLVIMSSYDGRVDVSDDVFVVSSEMRQLDDA